MHTPTRTPSFSPSHTPTPTHALQDKTPAPLGQLGTLLEETYSQLVELADAAAATKGALAAAGQALGAGVQLLLLLVK
jgi:hypothetical protein